MRKKLTRALTFLLSLALLIAAGSAVVLAESYWNPIAGTSDWVAMDGNDIDGTPTPARTVMGSNGLTITYTGGEYTAGGTNSGVMYAIPVDLNNFSVEFTVTKRADYYNTLGTGCDSWISLCLLNQPDKYFNTKKAGQSQGIVTLIRPMETHTAFEITQLMNNFYGNSLAAHEEPGDMVKSYKVEIKKGDDGVYDYIVNGVTVDFASYGGNDFSMAFTRLMEKGDVYFYMGVSCKDSSQKIEWRITKINGVAVKADEPEETEPVETQPKETEPVETQPKETQPKETEPKETQPKETQPKETEPKETKPKETEPEETKPKETEPKETEPSASYEEVNETVYTTRSINVRSDPDSSSKKLGNLDEGVAVTRTGIGDNGWSRIEFDGKEAYVYSSYLTTTAPEQKPVETEPVETESVETEPVETEPVETEPVETEPVETEPVETEPVETEPVETEPVETESQPSQTESQPAQTESQPQQTEPVDNPPEKNSSAWWIILLVLVIGGGVAAVIVLKKKGVIK